MQIVLLRHGKPNIAPPEKIHAHELQQWVDAYNAAGLAAGQAPSTESLHIAQTCRAVVCSDLPRSLESARALGLEDIAAIDPVFREMALPYSRFPALKLAPKYWVILFRILWFLGYASNGESLREAKLRVALGATRLQEIAARQGTVLLVGHGMANRFLAQALLAKGWKGPRDPGRDYWSFGVYSRND